MLSWLSFDEHNIYLLFVFLASVFASIGTTFVPLVLTKRIANDPHRDCRVAHECFVKSHSAYIGFCAVLLRDPAAVDVKFWNAGVILLLFIFSLLMAFSVWRLTLHDDIVVTTHHQCSGPGCVEAIPLGHVISKTKWELASTIICFCACVVACLYPAPRYASNSADGVDSNRIQLIVREGSKLETLNIYREPEHFKDMNTLTKALSKYWLPSGRAMSIVHCSVQRLLANDLYYSDESRLVSFEFIGIHKLIDNTVLVLTREHWHIERVERKTGVVTKFDLRPTPAYILAQAGNDWLIRETTAPYVSNHTSACPDIDGKTK